MTVAELHRRASQRFGELVAQVGDDQWTAATPCSEWDVRALVNHIVYENRWTVPLVRGETIAEVGDRFEGDLLGDDPAGAYRGSSQEAVATIAEPGALERTVHLSFGDAPASEYVLQLFADHLVHGWDLARAIGADERLDPELVDACAAWFAGQEDGYRAGGAVGPRADVSTDAGPQQRLLAAFGRNYVRLGR